MHHRILVFTLSALLLPAALLAGDTRLNITIPKGFPMPQYRVEFLPAAAALQSTAIFHGRSQFGQSADSYSLPDMSQIAFVNSAPVWVLPGDLADIELRADSSYTASLGPAIDLVAHGPNATRQLVLFAIHRIYNIPFGRIEGCRSLAAFDHLLDSLDKVADRAIRSHTSLGQKGLSLMTGYRNLARLDLKYFYIFAADSSHLPASPGQWMLQGQDVNAPWLDLLGSDDILRSFTTQIEIGRMITRHGLQAIKHRFSLTEPGGRSDQLSDLLDIATSERLKCQSSRFFLSSIYQIGATPEVTAVIEKSQTAIHDKATLRFVDSIATLYQGASKGKPAFDFQAFDLSGKAVHLSDFKGKFVAIDFWGTWCATCIRLLPVFHQVEDSYKNNPNIVFLSLGDEAEDASLWKKFIATHGMEHRLNLRLSPVDGYSFKVMAAFGYNGAPRYALIDPEGKIVNAFMPTPDLPTYRAAIDAALNEHR